MKTVALQIRDLIMDRLRAVLPLDVALEYDPLHALPDDVSRAVVVRLGPGQPTGGPTGLRSWSRLITIYLMCRRQVDSDAVLEELDALVDSALPQSGLPLIIELERIEDEFKREEFGEIIAAKVVPYKIKYRTSETSLTG
jgi:hypothetical protein